MVASWRILPDALPRVAATPFDWPGVLLLSGALAALALGVSNIDSHRTEVPAEERAAAQGLLTVFIGVGQLLCGVLIGAIASSAGGGALGYREAFGTIAVLVAVMAVASLGLVNRRPA